MAKRKGGAATLPEGQGSLLPETPIAEQGVMVQVLVREIAAPNRRATPEEAAQVKAYGVFQNVVLVALQDPHDARPEGVEGPFYEIAAGNRRTDAILQNAEAEGGADAYVWALVLPKGTPRHIVAAVTLIENGSRSHNYLHEIAAVEECLRRVGDDEARISVEVGLDPKTVRSRIKLLGLIPPLREKMNEGGLSEGLALQVAKLPKATQETLTSRVFVDKETVDALRDKAARDANSGMSMADRWANVRAKVRGVRGVLPEEPTALRDAVAATLDELVSACVDVMEAHNAGTEFILSRVTYPHLCALLEEEGEPGGPWMAAEIVDGDPETFPPDAAIPSTDGEGVPHRFYVHNGERTHEFYSTHDAAAGVAANLNARHGEPATSAIAGITCDHGQPLNEPCEACKAFNDANSPGGSSGGDPFPFDADAPATAPGVQPTPGSTEASADAMPEGINAERVSVLVAEPLSRKLFVSALFDATREELQEAERRVEAAGGKNTGRLDKIGARLRNMGEHASEPAAVTA